MSLVRVLRTAQQTLTRKIYSDETLTDAGGPVTVEVARLDGTVLTSGSAVDAPGAGTYSFVLPGGPAAPASVTWQLDTLKVTWSGSVGGAVVTLPPDYVEVVGEFYFGLPEARQEYRRELGDSVKWPLEKLAQKRTEIEQECDAICGGRAFVPRFMRVAVTGNGRRQLMVPHADIRRLRAVSVDGSAVDPASASLSSSGVLTRIGMLVWPAGQEVVVEYEHGLDYPPEGIRTGAMARLASKLHKPSSNIPANAISFNVVQGGVYRLSTPSARRTGIPDVDAEYERYGALVGGFA